jgi:hypothetical protein
MLLVLGKKVEMFVENKKFAMKDGSFLTNGISGLEADFNRCINPKKSKRQSQNVYAQSIGGGSLIFVWD